MIQPMRSFTCPL